MVHYKRCADKMSYVWTGLSAKIIASYFLELGRRDSVPIDPMKLQKLIYLAHGWSLVFLGRPLISDQIEAWQYGPVVPTIYQDFKRFGASAIIGATCESSYGLDEKTRSLLNEVWERYKPLSAIQLSMLTHEAGSAWDLVRRQTTVLPWGGPRIPNALIADEFTRRQQHPR